MKATTEDQNDIERDTLKLRLRIAQERLAWAQTPGAPVGFYRNRRGQFKPVTAKRPAKGGRNFRYL